MKSIIPQHIAIIMDGNRRWATEKGLAVDEGHKEGYKRIEPIVDYAAHRGIEHMTFWAFSSENWNRGEEVGLLMDVFRLALKDPVVPRLIQKGVKVNIIGDMQKFPKDIIGAMNQLVTKSAKNSKITVNMALNYGGRAEILHAVRAMIKDGITDIDEKTLSDRLYTKNQPDPDMIIRTGGEQRLSGFLPWQGVYSELFFTKTYWPDFDEKEFDRALKEFVRRERRYGK